MGLRADPPKSSGTREAEPVRCSRISSFAGGSAGSLQMLRLVQHLLAQHVHVGLVHMEGCGQERLVSG